MQINSQMNFSQEARQIANITVEEFNKQIASQLEDINKNEYEQIENINTLIKRLQNKLYISKQGKHRVLRHNQYSEKLVYKTFFELQNAINEYLGQKIVITYVHVDKNNKREIKILDNTYDLLTSAGKYKSNLNKIGTILINQQIEEENNFKAFENTVTLAEERYKKSRQKNGGIIYWWTNRQLSGYYLSNKGAINEAYVNFYLHLQNLKGYFSNEKDKEKQLEKFVTNTKYGVITADSENGFVIGDISTKNIQYAIKGENAEPQGYAEVFKNLEQIQKILNNSYFSKQDKLSKIKEQLYREPSALIKEATKEQLKELLQFIDIP